MKSDRISAAIQSELAKYKGPLARRIEVIGPPQMPGKTGRRFGGGAPSTPMKTRCIELSCGHQASDRVEARNKFPERSVGDLMLCTSCSGAHLAQDTYELENGRWWLNTLAHRTKAAWEPLFKGAPVISEAYSIWERVKPLLRPEVIDLRLEALFPLARQLHKKPYEPPEAHEVRILAIIPQLVDLVMRAPIEDEPPPPKPSRTRRPTRAPKAPA